MYIGPPRSRLYYFVMENWISNGRVSNLITASVSNTHICNCMKVGLNMFYSLNPRTKRILAVILTTTHLSVWLHVTQCLTDVVCVCVCVHVRGVCVCAGVQRHTPLSSDNSNFSEVFSLSRAASGGGRSKVHLIPWAAFVGCMVK